MATQMETDLILFDCRYLQSRICWGGKHAVHLATILKKDHNITEDWEEKKYAGIDLKSDYEKRTWQATMDGYI